MNGDYDKDIVALTTAQKVANDRQDRTDEIVDELDRAIRGDRQNTKDSVFFRLQEVERFTTEFRRVFFSDEAGNPGYKAKIDALISGKMDAVERRKSNASIIIAIITSTALVLTNLDHIGEFWVRIFGKSKPDKLERMIDQAEHPHVKRYKVHYVPPDSSDSQE